MKSYFSLFFLYTVAFLRFKRLSFSHSVLPIYKKEISNLIFLIYITTFLRQLIHYLINSCQRTNFFQLQRYFMQNCSNSGSSICTTRCFVIPVWMTSIFNYIITWQSSSILYQSFFHLQQIRNALNSTHLKVTMHGQFHWNQRIHIKCIMAAL